METKGNIYTDCYKIVKESNYFLYLFIGGRQIGKTYSMLHHSYFGGDKILYIRRTEVELKNCCNNFFNPYKKINMKEGTNIQVEKTEDSAVIMDHTDEDNLKIVGYAAALSTFGKFRGADFSDVDTIVFDEFINTSPYGQMNQSEATLLFNLIETVNSNRELEGGNAIKVVLLSNANTIDNDIIRCFSLAEVIHQMKKENKHLYTDDEKGLYLALLENKEVHDLKMKSKLYKLVEGTSFYDMALNNEFVTDFFGDVKKINYNELKPLCSFNEFFVYEHKSANILFVCKRKANCPKYDNQSIKAFKRSFGFRILWYMDCGYCFFSDYNTKLAFKQIFKNRKV